MCDESIDKLTDEQRDNLRKLADYLDSGKLKAKFDMDRFSELRINSEQTCGSVGCAIGHGPYVGIIKEAEENWYEYAERVFGMVPARWAWLFSSNWKDVDNTPEGAAARIRYYLEHGMPKNYAPWSYEEAQAGH